MTDQEELNRDHASRIAKLEQISEDIRDDFDALEKGLERLVGQVQSMRTALTVIAIASVLSVDWAKLTLLLKFIP